MSDDTVAPFLFPAIGRKKITAAFDGGRITSDGGVMLLAAAERRLGIADHLAGLIADPRNPLFVTQSVADAANSDVQFRTAQELHMSLATIVIIVVLLVVLGGGWGYRSGTYGGDVFGGGIGLVVLIVVLILVFGR